MKRVVFLLSLLVAAPLAFGYNFFSPTIRLEVFPSPVVGMPYYLTDKPVIDDSESVWAEWEGETGPDTLFLAAGKDYTFDPDRGQITFTALPDSARRVWVEYTVYPPNFINRFYYFRMAEKTGQATGDSLKRREWRLKDTSDLSISGSKSLALSFGNNRDLAIDQALYVKISGQLAPNVRVEAQVTDSQSPITPEGDSRELSTMDQVYIKVFGKQYEVAFGDLDFPITGTQFMNYNPQFEGLRLGWYDHNEARGAFAVSRGKSMTRTITGVEGKQGPYYLYPDGAVTGVLILSGSEEITLDGVTMQRGSDYTIDYSEGSITFTQTRFITSESRIRAIFQYADEDYRKSLYLSSVEWNPVSRLKVTSQVIAAVDDEDNPLQYTLTDADRDSLALAGDHLARGIGAFETDSGEGYYEKRTDPVSGAEYFYYTGPDSTGSWTVIFSYVGEGNGDYNRTQPGVYTYVGQGAGSWIAGKVLTAPVYHGNFDLGLSWDGSDYTLKTEAIVTDLDRNTLSDLDDDDNVGWALHAGFDYRPQQTRLQPFLLLSYRFLDKNLEPFAEIEEAALADEIHTFPAIGGMNRQEYAVKTGLTLWEVLKPEASYLRRDWEDEILFERYALQTRLDQTRYLPNWNLSLSRASQVDERPDSAMADSRSDLATNTLGYDFNRLRILTTLHWRENTSEADDTGETGDRLVTRKLEISTLNTTRVAAGTSVEGEELRVLNDDWMLTKTGTTWKADAYLGFEDHQAKMMVARRAIRYPSGSEENQTYDMATLDLRHSLLNDGFHLSAGYSLENTEFYKKAWRLVKVDEGTGHYDSEGNLVENGDYDREYINTGETELSITVKGNATATVLPRQFISETSSSPLRNLQWETAVQVQENSNSHHRWDVYLLDPAHLRSPETTLYGRQSLRNTLWYDLIRNRASATIQNQRDETLDNRYQEQARSTLDEWRTALGITGVGINDFDLIWTISVAEESQYESKVTSNDISVETRTKPFPALSLQTDVSVIREEGRNESVQNTDYSLTGWELSETVVLFVMKKHRLFGRAQIRKNDREGSSFLTNLADKREGTLFRWSMTFSYKVNSFTNASLEYSGDSLPEEDVNHRFKAEIRAEF